MTLGRIAGAVCATWRRILPAMTTVADPTRPDPDRAAPRSGIATSGCWQPARRQAHSYNAITPVALAFAVLVLGGSAVQLGLVVAAFALAEVSTTLFGAAIAHYVAYPQHRPLAPRPSTTLLHALNDPAGPLPATWR
jgi:hypothetical protein